MKQLKKKLSLIAVVAVLGGLSGPLPAEAQKTKIAVVVKADGALTDLSLKDIKAIYTGEKLFQGSNKIEPLVNGNEVVTGSFLKKVLEKTKAQYKKIWNSKAFVDGLTAPTVLPDSTDVLRAVNKDDGAIGFVDESDITPSQRKLIKVIYLTDLAG